MADKDENLLLRLELVAPTGPVFEGDVQMVVLASTTGELGILPHHASLVAQLGIGRLRALMPDGDWMTFAVAEGFAKVQFNKVIVLADAAEEASQIDVERVQQRLERATQRLEMLRLGTMPEGETIDPYREQMALKRARNRLRVAERPEK
jgi:F-type H+-transporting ATPase subunit epsilon